MADMIPGMPPTGGAPPAPSPLGAGPSPIPTGSPKIGPVAQPLPNLGNQVQATAKIANAIKELQDALPQIPMGSELHNAIFKIIPQLTKAMGESKPDASMQLQELIRAAKEKAQGGPMAALGRMYPQPGGGGQPPAMPAPGPAAAPAMAA